MKRYLAYIVFAAMLIVPCFCSPATASRTFEELVEIYSRREEARPEAASLENRLLESAWEIDEPGLWHSLKDFNLAPEQRAANGLDVDKGLVPRRQPGSSRGGYFRSMASGNDPLSH